MGEKAKSIFEAVRCKSPGCLLVGYISPVNLVDVLTTPCSKKGCHQTHGGNFIKSQPIFKILSPLEREGNFQ